RKNFRKLLLRVTQGSVLDVTVTYRDRLCRFGSELVEFLFEINRCTLSVLHEVHDVSDEQELARDLMDIVHVFSSRRNGRRRYARSQKDKEGGENRSSTEGEEDSGSSSLTADPGASREVSIPDKVRSA